MRDIEECAVVLNNLALRGRLGIMGRPIYVDCHQLVKHDITFACLQWAVWNAFRGVIRATALLRLAEARPRFQQRQPRRLRHRAVDPDGWSTATRAVMWRLEVPLELTIDELASDKYIELF